MIKIYDIDGYDHTDNEYNYNKLIKIVFQLTNLPKDMGSLMRLDVNVNLGYMMDMVKHYLTNPRYMKSEKETNKLYFYEIEDRQNGRSWVLLPFADKKLDNNIKGNK